MPQIVCEWDLQGIEAWRGAASVIVIVDVLSFSTTVSIAIDRGAAIIPFAYGNAVAAADEAERRGVIVALPRRAGGGQFSLSPASSRCVDAGARILLPSPNGSGLSLATGDIPTLCACLRNADAIARHAAAIAGDGTIVVIAAGERWPDQSLRSAIEDWLGASMAVPILRDGAYVAASLSGDRR